MAGRQIIPNDGWVTDPPENDEWITDPIPEQDDPSLWQRANTPLIPQIAKSGRALGNKIDSGPSLNRSPREAYWKGMFGGMAEGLGDVAASMTSPLGIASNLVGIGGLGAGARGLRTIGKVASAIPIAHGAGQVATGDTWGERGGGLLEIAGGLLGLRAAAKYEKAARIKLGTKADVLIDAVDEIKPKTELQVKTPPPEVLPAEVLPIESLNPEFDAKRQFFIDDAERMRQERINAPRNVQHENMLSDWDIEQKNNAIYEGRNINDARTPLTPQQEIIKKSFDKIRAHSDEYSNWYAEQEAALPEGQVFEPPPDVHARYLAEQEAIQDAHRALVEKTGLLHKPRTPDIDVTPTTLPRQLTSGEAPVQQGPPGTITQYPKRKSNPYPYPRETPLADGSMPIAPMGPSSIAESVPPSVRQSPPRIPAERQPIDALKEMMPKRPKIKTILNKETNTLEPDMNDPATRVIVEGARPKPVVPKAEPTPPNRTEALALEHAYQPELGLDQPVQHPVPSGKSLSGIGPEPTVQGTLGDLRLKRNPDGTPDLTDPHTQSAAHLADSSGRTIDEAERALSIMKKTPLKPEDAPSKFREFWDLAKGMQSVDLPFITSAGFRQANGYMLNKNWWTAWAPSVKAYGSELAFKAQLARIKQSKYFKATVNSDGSFGPAIADEMGVFLDDGLAVHHKAEVIRSKLAENFPLLGRLIKRSNRSFGAYMNELRSGATHDLMEATIQNYEAAKASGGKQWGGLKRNLTPQEIEELNPMTNKVLQRQMGEQIMTLTGVGKLETKIPFTNTVASLEHPFVRDKLNTVMYSPALTAAHIQRLDPRHYIFTNKATRRQYLRSALATGVSAAVTSTLSETLGMGANLNPLSSDFGKARFGDTRVDFMGGVQQPFVLAMRAAMGETTNSKGETKVLGEGYKADRVTDIAQNYLRNRAHPMVNFALTLVNSNKKQPVGLTDAVLQTYSAIIVQDAIELGQEDFRLLALLPFISAGAGTNTFKAGEFKQNRFLGKGGFTESMNRQFGRKILPTKDFQVKSISPGQWLK